MPIRHIEAVTINQDTSCFVELLLRSLYATHSDLEGIRLTILDNNSTDEMRQLRALAEDKKIPIVQTKWSPHSPSLPVLPRTYRGYNRSGKLVFNPKGSKNPSITFATTGRNSRSVIGNALSYLVIGTVTGDADSVRFNQDQISAMQQQFIDLKRTRWGQRHTPPRRTFRTSLHSGHYSTGDYNTCNTSHFLMNMWLEAEVIRKAELKALGSTNPADSPRITSGYREPKHSSNTSGTLHQYGYAVDMNPSARIYVATYLTKRREMCKRVEKLYNDSRYDVRCHGKGSNYHTHIEYDP